MSFCSNSLCAKGAFKHIARRLYVLGRLSEASIYPHFSAGPSQGIDQLLDLGLLKNGTSCYSSFYNNWKRSFKANKGLKPPQILPPGQVMEKAGRQCGDH